MNVGKGFKEGDRVRIISTIYDADELQVGQIGTVVQATYTDSCDIQMDNGYEKFEDYTWPFYHNELELV